MTDPAALGVDEPAWEDARGPHLPDRLTRISPLVWPFVALAVIQVITTWQDNRGQDLWFLARSALGSVNDVTLSLLGAALFLRHRDAVRTLPMVVAGVVLLAVEEVLHVVSAPLQPVLESVWPAIDDASGLPLQAMTASTVFNQFTLVIGVFGVLYMARGLDGARRFEGATSRVVAAGLVLLALITTGTLVYGYLRVPEGAVLGGTWLIALSIVVALASSLATAYLVSVAFAGWRADEEPGLGWALVVVSGVVTMLATAGFIAAAVWQVGAVDVMSTLFATVTAIAGAALLAAFFLGLPSTEPIEWEEDDPEVESEPTLDPPAATTPGSAGS